LRQPHLCFHHTLEPGHCAVLSCIFFPPAAHRQQVVPAKHPLPCSHVAIQAAPAGMHTHLQDEWTGWQDDFPDLVVMAA
jgi:hypothetical protein